MRAILLAVVLAAAASVVAGGVRTGSQASRQGGMRDTVINGDTVTIILMPDTVPEGDAREGV